MIIPYAMLLWFLDYRIRRVCVFEFVFVFVLHVFRMTMYLSMYIIIMKTCYYNIIVYIRLPLSCKMVKGTKRPKNLTVYIHTQT